MAALLTMLLAAAPFSAAGEKYALVVGVNDCPNFRLPGGARPRPLLGAECDAEALAQLLQDRFAFAPQNVRLLKGEAATRQAVLAAMAELLKSASADDQVVFHFSGHGTQVPDRKPLDEPDGLDEALCLYDCDADGENLLIDDEIGQWLDRLASRRVTVVLDCCHAGTGTKELGDDIVARFLPSPAAMAADPPVARQPDRPHEWNELRGTSKSLDRRRTALFACQPEQQAYERRLLEAKPVQRRGQFSYYLIESLGDPAADLDGDGVVSSQEALLYVEHKLDGSFNAQRTEPKDQQHPALDADRRDEPPF